jgi:superfamily I DNA/RNA helicase
VTTSNRRSSRGRFTHFQLTTQRTAGAWADLNCSESLARPDRSSGNSLEINKTLREWIETVGDDAELQEVYDTERHLLYAACTRARDHLLITSVEPASEFLDDLRM